MRRKPSKADSDDIELPLLGEEIHLKDKVIPEAKSYFIDFFNPDISPLKYIKNMSFIKLVTFFDMWLFASSANAKPGPLQPNNLPLPFDSYNVEQKILAL